jgi:hypothetical protein
MRNSKTPQKYFLKSGLKISKNPPKKVPWCYYVRTYLAFFLLFFFSAQARVFAFAPSRLQLPCAAASVSVEQVLFWNGVAVYSQYVYLSPRVFPLAAAQRRQFHWACASGRGRQYEGTPARPGRVLGGGSFALLADHSRWRSIQICYQIILRGEHGKIIPVDGREDLLELTDSR